MSAAPSPLDLFRRRLRSTRQQLGLSCAELSRRLGYSDGVISAWEAGRRWPRFDQVPRVAEHLGVTLAWLIGATPDDCGPTRKPLVSRRHEPRRPESAADVLADYMASPGLRELAQDHAVVAALDIQPDEWRVLASIELDGPVLAKDGYLAVLVAIRSNLRLQRMQAELLPGRPRHNVTKT
ncbi:MAG: helix-turn-helix domain-containing protein [Thiohalocapsa sp.]|nr:helix-turn-helix domain-containing protein [Thiohalocapsa sp.]